VTSLWNCFGSEAKSHMPCPYCKSLVPRLSPTTVILCEVVTLVACLEDLTQVTRVVVLSVPWANVQHTILVPWGGIVMRCILAHLECHYGVVVGNCLSI
jgi:hypothetical protein